MVLYIDSGMLLVNKQNALPGVYILSQNFVIAPKRNKRMLKIFIIAPNLHVVRNVIS